MAHNFYDSLEKSCAHADDPIWLDIYRKAFPSLNTINCVRSDGWAQRGGIDRVLVLESGKTLQVDEKVRDKDYGDILLEYWSDETRKVRGWVAKDLSCDYIAYAVIPSKKCYLLPFQQLRKAWKENCFQWVRDYPRIEADNVTYKTVSVGVPVEVLFKALNDAMTVGFK